MALLRRWRNRRFGTLSQHAVARVLFGPTEQHLPTLNARIQIPLKHIDITQKTSRRFAVAMDDDYFPLRCRRDLFFEMPLQGRTAFGQTPSAEPSQGRENGRRKSARATGSARLREVIDGVAQGVEGAGGLNSLLIFVARGLAPRHKSPPLQLIPPNKNADALSAVGV